MICGAVMVSAIAAAVATAGITRQTLDRWLGDWTRTSEHLTA